MAKRVKTCLSIICVLIQFTTYALGYNATVHNRQLEQVLFGNDIFFNQEQKKAIDALEKASFLCIDQFNNSGEKQLTELKEYGILNLPTISEINFNSNFEHRKYTHKGWEPISGAVSAADAMAKWEKRKGILLATVNFVFDFQWMSGRSLFGIQLTDYSDQCKGLSALIYYVHLLGDWEDSSVSLSDYKKNQPYIIPFATAHPGDSNPDILQELIKIYIPQVFPTQTNSKAYRYLLSKLKDIAQNARTLAKTTGGINTEEKVSEYHNYIQKTIEILSEYIPPLLREESFFNQRFSNVSP